MMKSIAERLDRLIETQENIFPSPIRSMCENLKIISEFYGLDLLTKADYKREKRRIYRRRRQNKRK